ncbi:hypothetical protein NFI96_002101 [Prochilodus magdalenae]|nr:hypothetical protein NFI96_002101 [Prochilodus magdalenae]
MTYSHVETFEHPGTTERVCLIQGTVEALNGVHNFIAEKVREMPQSSQKSEPVSILQPQTTVNPDRVKQLEHPHTVPADGAVGVEVEGNQAFWTCDSKPLILVLTTVPPHMGSLGVSTKTKAGLVTEDDPLPF